MHIVAQRSEDGIDPIVPDMLKNSCRLWDEEIGRWPRHDDERGYPTKHWLLFVGSISQSELSESQRMANNYDMLGQFCKLASEAGKTVGAMDNNILPINKNELWVRDPEEYWLLLLHRLYPPQHDFWFAPKDENTPNNLTLSRRQARDNEPYIAVIDNVFLSSAMACGRLAALVNVQNGIGKLKPAETKRDATAAKSGKIKNLFWNLYKETLGVIVDKVLDRFWPKQ